MILYYLDFYWDYCILFLMFSASMGAFSAGVKAVPWEQALALLHSMCETSTTYDVIFFIAAISACEKGEQWEQAFILLHKMRETVIINDVISLNEAISACAKGMQLEQALALLHSIHETAWIMMRPASTQLFRRGSKLSCCSICY